MKYSSRTFTTIKGLFLASAAILFCLFSCKKKGPDPNYKFKQATRDYVAFVEKDSWWLYGIEGLQDSIRWTAISAATGMTDGSSIGGNTKYEFLNASIGVLPDIGFYECNLTASAGNSGDQVILGSNFDYTLWATETTIVGDGNLPLEDSLVVNGRTYYHVLHLINSTAKFKEIWIAPNVGFIKMKRDDNMVFYLKRYQL